jgi:hypothetical protein
MQNEDVTDNGRERTMEAAAATLERYPAIPDWLKVTVRGAISIADNLVPPSEDNPDTEAHLYPH